MERRGNLVDEKKGSDADTPTGATDSKTGDSGGGEGKEGNVWNEGNGAEETAETKAANGRRLV